jgi:hypothetical protein
MQRLSHGASAEELMTGWLRILLHTSLLSRSSSSGESLLRNGRLLLRGNCSSPPAHSTTLLRLGHTTTVLLLWQRRWSVTLGQWRVTLRQLPQMPR